VLSGGPWCSLMDIGISGEYWCSLVDICALCGYWLQKHKKINYAGKATPCINQGKDPLGTTMIVANKHRAGPELKESYLSLDFHE